MWEIIDAIGSFGAMILAGIAGFVAYRLFQVESKRDERLEQLALELQANSVGVWIDNGKLVAANLSPLPIYGLNLEAYPEPDDFTISGLPEWLTEPQHKLLGRLLAGYAAVDIGQRNGGGFRAVLRPGQQWGFPVR